MKKFRGLALLISLTTLLSVSPAATAEPMIGTALLDTMGEVAASTADFLAALPTSKQEVKDITIDTVYAKNKSTDDNTLGNVPAYGKAGLDLRMNTYTGYEKPEDLAITYSTSTDIKQGEICLISFIAQSWWTKDKNEATKTATFPTKFGLSNGTNTQTTERIDAQAFGYDDGGTFKWADKTYYAFEANTDYPAGSKFEIYLGFSEWQQGVLRDVELRNLKNEKELKLITYVTGQTKLTKAQGVTAVPASGAINMSANDAVKFNFRAPVSADFVLNDLTLTGSDNEAVISSFELSDDNKSLTVNINGMKPLNSYSLKLDNIITEDIDYRNFTYDFTTTEAFVINTTKVSGVLSNGTVKTNVSPLALRLKKGTNTVTLNVNNSVSEPETAYIIAAVYTGTNSNFADAKLERVHLAKKTDIGSFDNLSVNVDVDGSSQIVKIYVWDNLINKTPLCDEITLNCSN